MLVGTISVEVSEHLSQLLERQGIPHEVLNAKQHEKEAEIIAEAGQTGAVTIATNMAGRGVDIKLADGIKEVGGLYVLGTERHEARRIDNQLRGRSGRQGDPGESRFYLSGQDDLVRLFAGDRIYNIMERFKVPDDQPMEAKILSNQIENAQKKVEEQNFVMRKNVLKYDDVMNKQRTVIYEQRRRVLEGEDLSEEVGLWIDEVIESTVNQYTTGEFEEEWDLEALCKAMVDPLRERRPDHAGRAARGGRARPRRARRRVPGRRARRLQGEGAGPRPEPGDRQPLLRDVERFVILQVVDLRWREHLENMDYLREGVHLRSMAQKDPLVEYTLRGAPDVRGARIEIRDEVVRTLFHAEIEVEEADQLQQAQRRAPADDRFVRARVARRRAGDRRRRRRSRSRARRRRRFGHGGRARRRRRLGDDRSASRATARRTRPQRPCWCGSGKKFKRCHGA